MFRTILPYTDQAGALLHAPLAGASRHSEQNAHPDAASHKQAYLQHRLFTAVLMQIIKG